MRESIFSARIPLVSQSQEVPWLMKCDVIRDDERIEIRLIDTRDLFNFYVCLISPGDFYVIKREQDLRVDFDKFIRKTVEMLHLISRNRMIGIFTRESCKLSFVEKNDFKNITRLELKFSKPDDGHYKRYLADLISRMESDNVKLIKENLLLKEQCRAADGEARERIRCAEAEARECQRSMSGLQREVDTMRDRLNERSEELEKFTKLVNEKEKEVSRLQYEVERLNLACAKSEANGKRADELALRCEAMEAASKQSEMRCAKAIADADEIKKKYEKYKTEKRDAKESLLKAKKEIKELKEKLNIYEEKARELKKYGRNVDEKLRRSEEERRTLKRKLDTTQSLYAHLHDRKNRKDESFTGEGSMYDDVTDVRPETPIK